MSETLDADPPIATTPAVSALGRTDGRAGGWWWSGLRPLVLRLHFYVGIFVGPFLLVAASTGLLYTITPQLEQLVHRDALTVATVGTAAVPLRAQVAAAVDAVPDARITEIRPPRTPDGTTGSASTPPVSRTATRARRSSIRTRARSPRCWTPTGSGCPCAPGSTSCTATCCSARSVRCTASSPRAGCGCWRSPGSRCGSCSGAAATGCERTLLPEGSASGRVRPAVVARVGRALGRDRHAVPLRDGPDLVPVRRRQRHRAARSPRLVDTRPSARRSPRPRRWQPSIPPISDRRRTASSRRRARAGSPIPSPSRPARTARRGSSSRSSAAGRRSRTRVAVDPTTADRDRHAAVRRLADRGQAGPVGHRCPHGPAVRGREPGHARRAGARHHLHGRLGLSHVVAAAADPGRRCRTPGGNQRPGPGAVLLVGLVAVAAGMFLPVLGVTLLLFLLADLGLQELRKRRSRPGFSSPSQPVAARRSGER